MVPRASPASKRVGPPAPRPRRSPAAQQGELKAAVLSPPRAAGSEAGDWHWKVVRAFCQQRCGVTRCRSSCLNYLHRLGFVVLGLRRPKQRLLKADAAQREAVVREYRALRVVAPLTGAKIFFADEAHVSADADADADLRGKWVLRGQPALGAGRWWTRPAPAPARRPGTPPRPRCASRPARSSTWRWTATAPPRPRSPSSRSTQLRTRHTEPLMVMVIWDNGAAHGGPPLRASRATPDVRLRLVRLPADRPDCNADEHIGGWVRAEVTANTCFGTAANVRAHVDAFLATLPRRAEEVQRRCRTVLQAKADALVAPATSTAPPVIAHPPRHSPQGAAVPSLVLV